MSEPFFYIVLPTFNRSELVLRAVKSILSQGYKNYKLIIFNDGSTSDYSSLNSLISGLKNIQYIESENVGVNRLRNIVLDSIFEKNINLDSAFFFTLSDDDYLVENALSIMAEYIQNYKAFWYCFNCDSNSKHIFNNSNFTDFKKIKYSEFSKDYKGDKHFVFSLNAIKNIRYPSKYFKNGYEHIFYYQLSFKIQIIPETVKVIEYYDDGLSLSDLYEKNHTFDVLFRQIRESPKTLVLYKKLVVHIIFPKNIIKNILTKEKYYRIKKMLGLKSKN